MSRHPERLEDALGEEFRQRLARDARDQHALDVGAGVVEPRLAGLAEHRHLRERREPFVRRLSRPEHRQPLEELDHRRQREVGGEAPAGAEGQEVLDRDRARGRHDVVDRALGRPHDDRGDASSGSHRAIGSSSDTSPSSTRSMTAAAVIGFVIEAIRTIESGSISPALGDLDVLAAGNERGGARHRAALDCRPKEILQLRHPGYRLCRRPKLSAPAPMSFRSGSRPRDTSR